MHEYACKFFLNTEIRHMHLNVIMQHINSSYKILHLWESTITLFIGYRSGFYAVTFSEIYKQSWYIFWPSLRWLKDAMCFFVIFPFLSLINLSHISYFWYNLLSFKGICQLYFQVRKCQYALWNVALWSSPTILQCNQF